MLLVMLVPSLCLTQILVANDNACRLLGYSSHDLIGLKLTQFFLKPDCDVVEALSEEHVEADGHAAVVFGTVVSPGLWTGCQLERAAWGAAGGRRGHHRNRSHCCWPGAAHLGASLTASANLQAPPQVPKRETCFYCLVLLGVWLVGCVQPRF